jgi:hypothetical protein
MPRRTISMQINELKSVRMYSDSDSSLVHMYLYGNPSAEKFNYLRKTSWIPTVAMKLTKLRHQLYKSDFCMWYYGLFKIHRTTHGT